MALILPPTSDPITLLAVQLVRSIESRQPLYSNSPTYPWFRLLMDDAVRVAADKRVHRCALRLIVTYTPVTDRATIWTLLVFLNCTVPSSWPAALRGIYPNLELNTRTLYALATATPPPTVETLAQRTRELFTGYLTPPPPAASLSLIDLNPVRAGFVQLRDYLTHA
jgi:hypothetical protein